MTTQGQAVIYKDGIAVAIQDWDADGYPEGMGRSIICWAQRMVESGVVPSELEDYSVDYTYVVNLRTGGLDTVTISQYGECKRTYPLYNNVEEILARYTSELREHNHWGENDE